MKIPPQSLSPSAEETPRKKKQEKNDRTSTTACRTPVFCCTSGEVIFTRTIVYNICNSIRRGGGGLPQRGGLVWTRWLRTIFFPLRDLSDRHKFTVAPMRRCKTHDITRVFVLVQLPYS